MTDDRRSRITATMCSWRFLVSAILVALACAYVIPIERSIGLLTSTHANASTVSSGSAQAPAVLFANFIGGGTIALNWGQSASTCTTGYNIYRIADGEPDYTLIAFQGGIANTSRNDSGLAPLTVYTYYIETLCQDWNSPPSVTATAITP